MESLFGLMRLHRTLFSLVLFGFEALYARQSCIQICRRALKVLKKSSRRLPDNPIVNYDKDEHAKEQMLASIRKVLTSARGLYYSQKNLGKTFRAVSSMDEFLASLPLDGLSGSPNGSRLLDLGCGSRPQNILKASDVYGVDIRADVDSNVFRANLIMESIPFSDSSFDFCTAINFIEHVPRLIVVDRETCFPFVNLMSDIYRILKNGGFFLSCTPAFPAKEAYQDPTHVNIITEDSFPNYFCGKCSDGPWASIYGFKGQFELVDQAWLHNAFLITLMKAVEKE